MNLNAEKYNEMPQDCKSSGAGKQYYFLDQDKALIQVISDTPNPY